MRSKVVGRLLSCLVVFATAAPSQALSIYLAPLPERVAIADCVIVGKVTSIEAKPVVATRSPGGLEKSTYQIAVVKVENALHGAKGLTHIRIGFIAPPPNPVANGAVIRPAIENLGPPALEVGLEACFFLATHPEQTFFTAAGFKDVVDKKNPAEFEKNVTLVKRCAKLLGDPTAGLKSKDPNDRFLTAAMLITRYRSPKGSVPPKTEPIPAEQSQLILNALLDVDWTKGDPETGMMGPSLPFGRLGLTPQDGWTQPKNFKEYPAAAQKWLKANGSTYRIQRFVEGKAEKKE